MKHLVIAVLLLVGLAMASSSQAQTLGLYGTAVPIDVTVVQNPTGIILEQGRTYAVMIPGVYSYTSAASIAFASVWLPADGNGEIPHAGPRPDFPFGSIYARIGDGEDFLIGIRRTFVADTSGELIFFVNDNFTSDNQGTLVAFVYEAPPAS